MLNDCFKGKWIFIIVFDIIAISAISAKALEDEVQNQIKCPEQCVCTSYRIQCKYFSTDIELALRQELESM